MEYDHITTDQHLQEFLQDIATARSICFDTEFVSEHSYRPELCLIQLAADGRLAVIDPQPLSDLDPFWQQLAAGNHETIVHSGREEFLFGLRTTGRRPSNLFDVQIAAGLIGLEYPAAYHKLVHRLTGTRLKKGETRTDWRRRPLSDRQIEYALKDVLYLQQMRDSLGQTLEQLGRTAWQRDEMLKWQDDLEEYEARERWRRVSGISSLPRQSLAIVREVWRWRESEAERRDCSPKRVLRDDLIVELARRASADVNQMRAVRGLDRGDLRKHMPKISQSIQRALSLPESEWPITRRGDIPSQVTVLSQFLTTALASVCRANRLAPSLVGTVQDLRDLIALRLDLRDGASDKLPVLAGGWRAEVVGELINDFLAGKLAIRIQDPLSDEPLVFDRVKP